MKFKFLLATGFALGTVATSSAQNIPLEPAVRTGKLPNGFTYYIRHNEEPKNRVVMYLANKVGSVLEDEDQRGLAHFMEHMSFNGTTHYPKNELINYLQKAGVRFGADINAYTSFDETVYKLPLPTENPDVVKSGLEIMHDWAHSALLEPEEIDKERGVVLEEKRLGKGANDRLRTQYFPVILNNSRYASRLPIGVDEVLNNFKRPAIARFYHDWYRPDLQALIIVGDIDAEKMEQIVKIKFADLKNPENEKPRTQFTIPLTGKNQFIALTDPEIKSNQISVIIKKEGTPLHNEAEYRVHIIQDLFNSMMIQRFNEVAQQPKPPFLQGDIAISKLMANIDDYSVNLEAKPGELESGFKTVWRENERAKRFGFTQSELDRVKRNLLTRFENRLKEQNKVSSTSFVTEYVQYFLNGAVAPGIAGEYLLVKKDLESITLDDVNAIAKTDNKDTDRDILVTAPEKDKNNLPTEATILGWIKAVEAENITAYKDRTNSQPLLKKEPVAGKIVSEKASEEGITTLMLSNGVKVLVKPTDFKNDEIIFSAFAPGGTSVYSDVDYPSASATNVVPAFGAGNYTNLELNKFLSGKRLSIGTSIAENTENISGSATKETLETALQVMYAHLVEPRKDVALFGGMIDRTIAGLANRSTDPNTVFGDTVNAVLTNYSPRKTPPTVEKINEINLDKTYNIYKERFANASGFTFIFVGSIDMATLKPLLEKYVASLPAQGKIEQAKDLKIHPATGVISKTVYKGLEPKATVRLVFSGPFQFSFANRLKMEAFKETLQIRLLERLREDESGVYSPSAGVSFSKIPEPRFTFTIAFGCAPQNVDKLIASALDEIEKLKKDGPPQVNVDKYKAENEHTIETTVKTNNFWGGYISSQLQNKEDLNQIDSYVKVIDAITPADVKEIASKYITGKNYIRLVLMPEKKVN